MLVTRSDIPDEAVYQITKVIWENLATLQEIHGATKDMRLDIAIEGLGAPLHRGAIRYYREVGLTPSPHTPSQIGQKANSRRCPTQQMPAALPPSRAASNRTIHYEVTLLRWAAFGFALFHIYCNVFASISELWLAAIHFGGFCALCALMANESGNLSRRSLGYWLNVTLAGLAIATSAYLILLRTRSARAKPSISSPITCFHLSRSASRSNSRAALLAGLCRF